MNRYKQAFVIAIALGVVVSTAGAFPLTNVLLNDNADGWFTMQNIDQYGDDLDERAAENGGEIVVFTGHPSYVMAAENARLLFDMPRNHYFATTFNDTAVGDRFYARLTEAFRTGRAHIAVSGPMTQSMLEQNATAKKAFVNNYCRVQEPDTQQLYAETHSTLYRYQPNCPADQQPEIDEFGEV